MGDWFNWFPFCCDVCKSSTQFNGKQRRAFGEDEVGNVEPIGIGIVLKPSFRGATFMALEVHSLVPGSAAEECGGIMLGDILQSIDDKDVYRRPAHEVSKLLMGLPGSNVRIGLFRLFGPMPPEFVIKPFPEHLSTQDGVYVRVVVDVQRKIDTGKGAGMQWASPSPSASPRKHYYPQVDTPRSSATPRVITPRSTPRNYNPARGAINSPRVLHSPRDAIRTEPFGVE